jgi:hypothetical protein
VSLSSTTPPWMSPSGPLWHIRGIWVSNDRATVARSLGNSPA